MGRIAQGARATGSPRLKRGGGWFLQCVCGCFLQMAAGNLYGHPRCRGMPPECWESSGLASPRASPRIPTSSQTRVHGNQIRRRRFSRTSSDSGARTIQPRSHPVRSRRQRWGRLAIPLVVVGQCPTTPRLDRKPRLGAVQGLDLAPPVNAKEQGFVGRVEVQPHHTDQLLGKRLGARPLEGARLTPSETRGAPGARCPVL